MHPHLHTPTSAQHNCPTAHMFPFSFCLLTILIPLSWQPWTHDQPFLQCWLCGSSAKHRHLQWTSLVFNLANKHLHHFTQQGWHLLVFEAWPYLFPPLLSASTTLNAFVPHSVIPPALHVSVFSLLSLLTNYYYMSSTHSLPTLTITPKLIDATTCPNRWT